MDSPRKKLRVEIISSESSSSDSSSENDVEIVEPGYTCRVCLNPDKKARYICPRCLCRSCSLECSKRHKAQDQCSGERERVNFTPKSQMNEEMLLKDLNVIQDVSTVVESAARLDNAIALSQTGRATMDAMPRSPGDLGSCTITKGAKDAIIRQFGVVFRQSPACAARRRRNTTSYKRRKLKWRIEWVIHNENSIAQQFAAKGHLSSCTLKQAVGHAIRGIGSSAQEDDYHVMIVDEAVPSNQRGFILLDQSKSIEANLRGVVVIDFPTLHMVKKSLTQDRDQSEDYKIAIEQLPAWAQPVVRVRGERVWTFNDKPVYNRKFDATKDEGYMSPLSEEEDEEEPLSLVDEQLVTEYLPGEEELVDDF